MMPWNTCRFDNFPGAGRDTSYYANRPSMPSPPSSHAKTSLALQTELVIIDPVALQKGAAADGERPRSLTKKTLGE